VSKTPLLIVLSALALQGWANADLEAVKLEPNLEKRSDLAMANAGRALDEAREAYRNGENAKMQSALEEIRSSVELAQSSLQETGKHARRSPKHFKRVEMSTRSLLRRLQSFESDVSVEERPAITKLRSDLELIRDQLVLGIMSKKK
jgi:hypothetical protein